MGAKAPSRLPRLLLPMLAALALGSATGCGSHHTSTPACNPVGAWTVTLNFGSGTCGLSGTSSDAFTVIQTGTDPLTYGFQNDNATSMAGDVTVGESCDLFAVSANTALSPQGTILAGDVVAINRTFTLAGTTITGSGTLSDTTTRCTQPFTVASGTFVPTVFGNF